MILPVTPSAVEEELQNIGVHPASMEIFKERAAIRPLKLYRVRMPAANIIKQELLSSGADCAINQGCVSGSVDYTDVLLLGTSKNYHELVKKLLPMTFFGLPQISEQIKGYLSQAPMSTVLADGRMLDYSRVLVMGIINITKDSFYAESRYTNDEVLAVAGRMIEEGADILDIGGESTRPGSLPISAEEEQERILPAIKAIKKAYPESIVSVDTYRVSTMRAALEEGADIINDITGGAEREMAALAAESRAPIIVMHMRGEPRTMQNAPHYEDVVKEVYGFFAERARKLNDLGVGREKIIIDPGIGFGKNTAHNLSLLKRLAELSGMGLPVLLATSRKRIVGEVLGGLPPEERLEGTLALSCQAVLSGVNMVRVHDVKENVRVIRMLEAVQCG